MIIFPRLYTVGILYYIPRTHILQSFIWQCEDVPPTLPRIKKYINHWHTLNVVLADINIAECSNKIQFHDGERNL
jgi:uncharacterized protein Usg